MSPAAGPPPVEPSRAVQTVDPVQGQRAMANYQTIVNTLKANNGQEARAFRAMLGDKATADRFLAVAFALLAKDSDLLFNATPMSIIQAIKDAASLGLEPMTEDGAIVRYKDQAKFMPMYRGYLKRILRVPNIVAVDVGEVMTNDEFDFWTTSRGTEFRHHPAKALKEIGDDGLATGEYVQGRGNYQGFYAYAITRDGFCYFRYLDVDQINHTRDTYGYTGKDSPWVKSYPEMAKKTVLRLLRKMLPQEANAVAFEAVEKGNDEAMAELRGAMSEVSDSLGDVRQLALRAVGALPPPQEEAPTGPVEEPPPAEGDPTTPEPPPATAPDPAVDPNVAAAMREAEEQRRRHRESR